MNFHVMYSTKNPYIDEEMWKGLDELSEKFSPFMSMMRICVCMS